MASPYRELPVAHLADQVACVWEHEPAGTQLQLIVPDGCLDLIWLAESELVVAGADTGPRVVELPAGRRSSAVRLRSGSGGAFLGRPAEELRDRQVPAGAIWGRAADRLQERLDAAAPTQRLRLLARFVAQRRVAVDALVDAARAKLAQPGARVSAVAADLGVSERHLHRRTLAAVGYGPKMLARVARLAALAELPGQPLAARALAAGYASQSHMNEDVRRLTGLTPVRFLEDLRSPAS